MPSAQYPLALTSLTSERKGAGHRAAWDHCELGSRWFGSPSADAGSLPAFGLDPNAERVVPRKTPLPPRACRTVQAARTSGIGSNELDGG